MVFPRIREFPETWLGVLIGVDTLNSAQRQTPARQNRCQVDAAHDLPVAPTADLSDTLGSIQLKKSISQHSAQYDSPANIADCLVQWPVCAWTRAVCERGAYALHGVARTLENEY